MRLARLRLFASIGLMLFHTAGCYRSYAPTYGSPNGVPYGTPGGPPVQTLTPGSPYTPSYPQGAPGSVPTPADPYNAPGSTFEQGGSGGSAPFYEPNSSNLPPYNGGGVPTYPDAGGEVQFQQQSSPKPIAEEQEFDLIEQGALEGAGATTSNVAKVPLNTAEFLTPLRGQRHPSNGDAGVATYTDAAPSPFAHDANNHRWLRGVARRNEATGNWSVIYSVNETEVDQYQGWLTLASDPRLSQLVPNGAYLLKGQVDESKTDPSGKPVYRVQSITPWHPSATN